MSTGSADFSLLLVAVPAVVCSSSSLCLVTTLGFRSDNVGPPFALKARSAGNSPCVDQCNHHGCIDFVDEEMMLLPDANAHASIGWFVDIQR